MIHEGNLRDTHEVKKRVIQNIRLVVKSSHARLKFSLDPFLLSTHLICSLGGYVHHLRQPGPPSEPPTIHTPVTTQFSIAAFWEVEWGYFPYVCLSVCAAALPSPMKTKAKVEQGKRTADHLMPLGYFFGV